MGGEGLLNSNASVGYVTADDCRAPHCCRQWVICGPPKYLLTCEGCHGIDIPTRGPRLPEALGTSDRRRRWIKARRKCMSQPFHSLFPVSTTVSRSIVACTIRFRFRRQRQLRPGQNTLLSLRTHTRHLAGVMMIRLWKS